MKIHSILRPVALAMLLAFPACTKVVEKKPVVSSVTTTEETTTVRPVRATTHTITTESR